MWQPGWACAGWQSRTHVCSRLPGPRSGFLPCRRRPAARFQLLVGGTSVSLTGLPWCGKTHLVNEAVELMRHAGLSVAVCASTGVAATLVGGTTVHS